MWLSTYARAVLAPSARRALGLWAGTLVVAAVIFGPTGMQPRDLTGLALGNLGVGAALVATWLLLIVPLARGVVRGDAGAYLRALPGPPRAVVAALAGATLVAIQLPWLALWLLGDGVRGAGVVAATTLVIAAIAAVRLRPLRAGQPRWTRGAAMRALYTRALRRRAGDALARCAGLALLAGVVAALLVRNNELAGAAAATLGAGAIAVALVPAQVGVLAVLADAHRTSAWLAASTGVSDASRAVALALAILAIDAAAVVIATGAALALIPAADALAAGGVALALAVAAAVVAARTIVVHAESPSLTSRLVVGAMVVAAVAVLWLGALGPFGAAATIATAVVVSLARVAR
jgi:hypothetical protein|nr:hypothetical protein [Kofleriaceae bacterium]